MKPLEKIKVILYHKEYTLDDILSQFIQEYFKQNMEDLIADALREYDATDFKDWDGEKTINYLIKECERISRIMKKELDAKS
jgi:glutamate mutase epsilon subunit